MNARKVSTRLLSFLLAFCMVFGMLPVTALTADAASDTDYLFLATDRHSNESVIGNILTKMEKDVGDGEIDYVGLGGDMVNNKENYASSTVLGEVTAVASNLTAANVDLVYASSHDVNCNDDASIMNKSSGVLYTDDDYYVYGITQDDMGYNNASLAETPVSDFYTWVNSLSATDNRAIIVLSHLPIHASRGDNLGAGLWHNALNYAATGSTTGTSVVRNVLFFHGHNHTTENNKEYFYSVGSTISVESYVEPSDVATVAPGGSSSSANGTNATIWYTYTTAGYLNANGKATMVTIDDSEITLTKYTSDSASTLGTVTRVVTETHEHSYTSSVTKEATCTEAGVKTFTCECGDSYTEEIAIIDHSYGEEGTVTTAATCTEAGVMTYTCTNCGAAKTEEIAATGHSYKDGTCSVCGEADPDYVAPTTSEPETDEPTTTAPETPTTTAPATEEPSEPETEEPSDPAVINAIAVTTLPTKTVYDVGETLDTTGMVVTATYSDGTTDVVTGWYTSTVDMATEGEKNVTVNYSVDGIIFKTIFTITVKDVPAEDAELTSITVDTSEAVTEYVSLGEIDITGLVVKANYNDGTSFVLDYAPLNDGEGYMLEFNAYKVGTQTVTVSYGDCTVTYEITIQAASEDSVPDFEATEVASETVADALAELELTDYVAYDLNGTIAEGATATVSILAPEGWTYETCNVYYLDSEGKAVLHDENVAITDGVITFQTTHFSTWVVAGDTTDDGDGSVTVGGGTATTYTYASSATAGSSYILVSNGYALMNNNGSISAVAVTVNSDDTLTISDSVDLDSILWTIDSDGDITNDDYFMLRQSGSGTKSMTISKTDSGSNYSDWTYSDDTLYTTGGNDGSTKFYAYYSSGWYTQSSSSQELKFYSVTEGESSVTYTLEASDVEHIYDADETTAETKSVSAVVKANGTETTSLGGTYSYNITDNTDGIIDVDKTTADTNTTGTIYFTDKTGTAEVRVYYTFTKDNVEYTIWDDITITAKAATKDILVYKVTDGTEGTEAMDTFPVKGVTADSTVVLTAALMNYNADNPDGVEDTAAVLTWSVISDTSDILDENAFTSGETTAATVTSTNSNVTLNFTGNGGMATVRVEYTDGTFEDITVTAAKTTYYVPEDGTNDFPDYPDEGAVVIDKTATAVGDFNETGIAQVELNMFGIPSGGAVDVVLMLDTSGSMRGDKLDACKKASIEFLKTIVKTGNSYNGNRIHICDFDANAAAVYPTTQTMLTVSDDTTYNAAVDAINDLAAGSGTNYLGALQYCQQVLAATKTEGRAQYLCFMSDGAPTYYEYITATNEDGTYTTAIAGDSASSTDTISTNNYLNYDEYYSTLMKSAGVKIYTVGLHIDTNSHLMLLGNISSNETKNVTTDTGYAYFISEDEDASKLTDVFTNIAGEIAAATNVTVNDQIADEYSMIFALPENVTSVPNGQEFYIEVVNYKLDKDSHERTGESESLIRVYLEDGTFKAYTVENDDVSTKTVVNTTYKEKAEGSKGYFNWTDTNGDNEIDDGEITYVSDGSGAYNISTGVYSEGTGESLILVTPYFTYIAETQDLTWTTNELGDDHQIAIRYFVYLEGSAGSVGDADQTEPGVYETNTKATVTYTNHLKNECQKTFPVPQMTWSGAQVGVTFYLVNAAGQPINRSGEVVPFAAATFVTGIHYESVVWNTNNVDPLRANVLATEYLPEEYTLYDSTASYMIHVYKNEENKVYNDFFEISGAAEGTMDAIGGHEMANDNTTHVYNTINGTNYTDYGVYSGTIEAGEKVSYKDISTGETATKDVDYNTSNTIDYSSTNVAFAVLWIPTLVEDTIVVDFGLPVAINVVQNDQLDNTIHTLGTAVKSGAPAINVGHSSTSPIDNSEYKNNVLTLANGDRVINYNGMLYYVQNDMEFNEPSVFYYDSEVAFTQNDDDIQGYMYSKVTVIPATTVYYEDSFLTLTGSGTTWETVGETKTNVVQGSDRPGVDKFGLTGYDADNAYGYDKAYETMSTYSLGSAAKVHVDADSYGKAEFTFYGTGFDVIGLTSNQTGYLAFEVVAAEDITKSDGSIIAEGTSVMKKLVDTYYGYTVNETGEWETVLSEDDPNPLYQVPVLEAAGLTYGKYDVTITATYNSFFDHTAADGYDLYLDAIRIYDPTGNKNATANEAYVKDGEGWPIYKELRNLVIAAGSFEGESVEDMEGAVFIDGYKKTSTIANYVSYGPNNELYLAGGQSIAFKIGDVFRDSATGEKSLVPVDVQIGIKAVSSAGSKVMVFNPGTKTTTSTDGTSTTVKTSATQNNLWEKAINTTTDMYYSIADAVISETTTDGVTTRNIKTDDVIVIHNGGVNTISITNLKFTFEEQATVVETVATGNGDSDNGSVQSLLTISAADAQAAVRSLTFYSETTNVAAKLETEEETTEATTEYTEEATTQATTEAATEVTTEATTEAATEVTTEATTEAATEVTTEATTEEATEVTTEATTETSKPAVKETKPSKAENAKPAGNDAQPKTEEPTEAEAVQTEPKVEKPKSEVKDEPKVEETKPEVKETEPKAEETVEHAVEVEVPAENNILNNIRNAITSLFKTLFGWLVG